MPQGLMLLWGAIGHHLVILPAIDDQWSLIDASRWTIVTLNEAKSTPEHLLIIACLPLLAQCIGQLSLQLIHI